MRTQSDQLTVRDFLSGAAARQPKTIGRMIDHRPVVNRKANVRPDVQSLVGIGILAKSEYLVIFPPGIGLGRVRLFEGITGDKEMHGLETDGDASNPVRRKTAEPARRGRLRPGSEQTFEQRDDVTAGFFPQ